jgi:hypothetical protein
MTDSMPPPELLRQLLEPSTAEAAASALGANFSWRVGVPPPELVSAWGDPRHGHESAVVRLARGWDSTTVVPALLLALDGENDVERRRRLAWILKQVATDADVPRLLGMAVDADEDRVVRCYLVEAATRSIPDWAAIEGLVNVLRRDAEALIREAVVALVGEGDDNETERRAMLIEFLNDDDPSVIVTALVALKRFSLLRSELSADLYARLYNHPTPHVRLWFRKLMG